MVDKANSALRKIITRYLYGPSFRIIRINTSERSTKLLAISHFSFEETLYPTFFFLLLLSSYYYLYFCLHFQCPCVPNVQDFFVCLSTHVQEFCVCLSTHVQEFCVCLSTHVSLSHSALSQIFKNLQLNDI